MTDRCAKSLNVLLDQVNAIAPKRDISSDGWIGDESHQTRSSDHNPYIHDSDGTWVVTARDFTNDPDDMPSQALADSLVASRDERIKYIISNKRICSGTGQDHEAWVWRPYSGSNPHDHHMHISVKSNDAYYDSEQPWKISLEPVPTPEPRPPVLKLPVLKRGDKGGSVKVLQEQLINEGYSIRADSDFGPKTEEAVKAFQYKNHLTVDGIVGPYTWRALGG